MGNKRHRIKISTYPQGVALSCFSDSSGVLFNTIATNGNSIAKPTVIIDDSDEVIYTSKARDNYGNKDCYHSYSEISAVLDLCSIKGITTQRSDQLSGPMLNYYVNGSYIGYHYLTGKSITSSSGVYFIVDIVSPTLFQKRGFINNTHYLTYTAELLSVVDGRYPYSTKYLNVRYTTRYEQWYKDKYKVLDNVLVQYQNQTPRYWGSIDNSIVSPQAAYTLIRTNSVPFKVANHFVPDNIVDDMYEKLTIPDVNNIENLKDFKNIRKSIPPVLNLLKKKNFKSLAELYLWYKYTYKTSELDLRAYYEFFQKWARQAKSKSDVKRISVVYKSSASAVGSYDEIVTRYQVITDPYNIGVLRTLGLDINLSNTWDLLPFSFVVDWFTNLGDILARLDHNEVISQMNIRSVISTTKRTMLSTPLIALNCASQCKTVYYYRSIGTAIPLGKLEVSLKNPGTHLFDGTALYVATKRS